jgi:hypothetical protein
MSELTPAQRHTLRLLIDAIHPAVDDIPSATDTGAAEALESALVDADWNGQRFFADAPHEPVPHGGHGWQGGAPPAQLFANVLAELSEPVQALGADATLELAVADAIDLGVISSRDLLRLLQRHILAHVANVAVR